MNAILTKKLLTMEFDEPVGFRQRFILIDVAKSEKPYTKGNAEIAKVIGSTKEYVGRAVRALVDRGFLERELEPGVESTKRTLKVSAWLTERIRLS
jgi:DNA-binding MarR family transcriptional regulator